jgi:GNAT superfamily N-acetyltransferase
MIRIEKAALSSATEISRIAIDSFMHAVAPEYRAQGVAAFRTYACPNSISERMALCSSFYVARQGERTIGMAELIHQNHLAMLFVEKERQRQGVGRALVACVKDEILADRGAVPEITVDAAPNAVGAYEKFRFSYRGGLREFTGMRFFPMRLNLAGIGENIFASRPST